MREFQPSSNGTEFLALYNYILHTYIRTHIQSYKQTKHSNIGWRTQCGKFNIIFGTVISEYNINIDGNIVKLHWQNYW